MSVFVLTSVKGKPLVRCSFASLEVAKEFAEVEFPHKRSIIHKVKLNADGFVIKDYGVGS